MTTIVLLFGDATAWTSTSPFNYAVRLLLCIRRVCIYSVLTNISIPKDLGGVALPVTRCVVLARVGLQEHNRDTLLYSCCGGANEVELEVVKELRKRRTIFASPCLKRPLWAMLSISKYV